LIDEMKRRNREGGSVENREDVKEEDKEVMKKK
jgi:hypothetical protein